MFIKRQKQTKKKIEKLIREVINFFLFQDTKHKISESEEGGPVTHGGDGFKCLNERPIGVGATILPSPKRSGEEVAGGAVGLGNDS